MTCASWTSRSQSCSGRPDQRTTGRRPDRVARARAGDAHELPRLRDERDRRARAARRARRPQARPPARPLRDARGRPAAEPPVQEVRRDRRRRDGQVPPARRRVDLRHADADGAALLAALPARRRAGQLRLDRRRPAGRDALHRGAPVADGDRDAARHRRRHRRLRPQLRRVAQGADGAAVPVPEPARQRLGRDRRRDGDEHAAAPARRDRRRDRPADRQARLERRRPDEARQGPRLPDRLDHPRPPGNPRRLPHRPRPDRDARARPHRGAARRQDGDHRLRASVRGQEGRRLRRDQEDRRPRPGEGDHRGLRPRRPLRPDGHADPDRAEARRDPAGRPEQALQAHVAAGDLRLQRRCARRQRAEDALAARARHALPRLPARDRHPAVEVRPAQGRGPRPRPRRLPDRARQPRRGDQGDPRRRRHRSRARGADVPVLALRDPGDRDPRPAPARPHRARAQARRAGVRRPPGADRRAARDPRRPGPDRRADPRGAARAPVDLRQVGRPAHRDPRRRGRVLARGHDRRGGHGDRDHALGLHQAPARDLLPRAAPRRRRRDGHGPEGRGLHRAPLRRLDARLRPLLHHRRQGLPAEGARAAARLAPVEGPRDRQPAARSARTSRSAP